MEIMFFLALCLLFGFGFMFKLAAFFIVWAVLVVAVSKE